VNDVLRAVMRLVAQRRLERAERAAARRAPVVAAPLSRAQRQGANFNAPIVPAAGSNFEAPVTVMASPAKKRGALAPVKPKLFGDNVKGTAKKPKAGPKAKKTQKR
jgi:hypothetical protein